MGAEPLLQLLKKYRHSGDVKASITVGELLASADQLQNSVPWWQAAAISEGAVFLLGLQDRRCGDDCDCESCSAAVLSALQDLCSTGAEAAREAYSGDMSTQ